MNELIKEMSNLQRHKNCPMRSEIGNCLAIGGFCTSVSKEICEGLQNTYTKGRHSVEASEDAISNGAISSDYIKGYREAVQRLEKFYLGETDAPSVIPQVPNEDCISREWVKEHMMKYGLTAPDMTVTENTLTATDIVMALREAEYRGYMKAVAERPQGKWLLSDLQSQADNDNGNYAYVCTNCNHTDIHAKTQKVPYCWWCGAKMKGADDD